LAEKGDKTQIATIALGARYEDVVRRNDWHHIRDDVSPCPGGSGSGKNLRSECRLNGYMR